MSTSVTALRSLDSVQLEEFNRRYQIVLSSCRLLTEAQSALDRSIVDFVSVAEALNPGTNLEYSTAAQASGSPPVPTISPAANATEEAVSDSGHDVVSKKEKKVRDPDQPKRPGSAFFIFQNAERNAVKSSMPKDSKGVDIQKAVTDKWKALSDSERKPYVDTYDRELKEYETKLATYQHDKGITPKGKSTSVAKAAPKKASEGTPVPTTPAAPVNDDDLAAAASLVVPSTTAGSPAADKSKGPTKKRARKSGVESSNKKEKAQPITEKSTGEKKEKKKRKKSMNSSQSAASVQS